RSPCLVNVVVPLVLLPWVGLSSALAVCACARPAWLARRRALATYMARVFMGEGPSGRFLRVAMLSPSPVPALRQRKTVERCWRCLSAKEPAGAPGTIMGVKQEQEAFLC